MLQNPLIREAVCHEFKLSEAQLSLQSAKYVYIKEFCSLRIVQPVFILAWVSKVCSSVCQNAYIGEEVCCRFHPFYRPRRPLERVVIALLCF
jgi:hypothetical protein